jgi:hypothetical protein
MADIRPLVSLDTTSFSLKAPGYTAPTYEFAYGNYLYTRAFFNEMSRVQQGLLSDTKQVEVGGKVLGFEKPGDLLALQNYMSLLEGSKNAVEGLGKKGLSVQYKALTNLYSQ